MTSSSRYKNCQSKRKNYRIHLTGIKNIKEKETFPTSPSLGDQSCVESASSQAENWQSNENCCVTRLRAWTCSHHRRTSLPDPSPHHQEATESAPKPHNLTPNIGGKGGAKAKSNPSFWLVFCWGTQLETQLPRVEFLLSGRCNNLIHFNSEMLLESETKCSLDSWFWSGIVFPANKKLLTKPSFFKQKGLEIQPSTTVFLFLKAPVPLHSTGCVATLPAGPVEPLFLPRPSVQDMTTQMLSRSWSKRHSSTDGEWRYLDYV